MKILLSALAVFFWLSALHFQPARMCSKLDTDRQCVSWAVTGNTFGYNTPTAVFSVKSQNGCAFYGTLIRTLHLSLLSA